MRVCQWWYEGKLPLYHFAVGGFEATWTIHCW